MISIAIDGPSGAGKSSLAKALAKDLGYVYVDTGAMYRSIGLYEPSVRALTLHDADAVAALLPQVKLGIRLIDGAQHIYLNGEDVSTAIRAEEHRHGCVRRGRTPRGAQLPAGHPARAWPESQNILLGGRDIGTVVLPIPFSCPKTSMRYSFKVNSFNMNTTFQSKVVCNWRINSTTKHKHSFTQSITLGYPPSPSY